MTPHTSRLNLLARTIPATFEICVVVIEPGCAQPYQAADWRGALIEVDHGQIELELSEGACHYLSAGDLFWLRDLPVRLLRNRGPEPTVLLTLTRASQPRLQRDPLGPVI